MPAFNLNHRSSGVLFHLTSLPGPHGIGDMGIAALRFISDLKKSGQTWWQMLPISPVDGINSPYNSPSAFAGNPLLIDLRQLVKAGLLDENDTQPDPAFSDHDVVYGAAVPFKNNCLKKAFANFQGSPKRRLRKDYSDFCLAHKSWLDSYALFSSLKTKFDDRAWTEWPIDVATRREATLDTLSHELTDDISFHKFVQFLFFAQWTRLKEYAAKNGIGLIGDIPIFVALDSADVWANPDLFHLNSGGKPSLVAGVPPDYFSKEGQLWGNPLYRWERHAETGYDWWLKRLKHLFSLFDAVRIDHFIGFYRAWAIPAEAKNAIEGTWMPGPRADFFKTVFEALLNPLLIAEDLGLLLPDVEALRDQFHLPGMKVLQFAFGNPTDKNFKRPLEYPGNCVVYTGTHDNNTTLGWLDTLKTPFVDEKENKNHEEELAFILNYMNSLGKEFNWDFIRLAHRCPALTAIIPMQDILSLGSEARMNTPGTKNGNWRWRMLPKSFSNRIMQKLKTITEESQRTSGALVNG